jgi:hypothetical protein
MFSFVIALSGVSYIVYSEPGIKITAGLRAGLEGSQLSWRSPLMIVQALPTADEGIAEGRYADAGRRQPSSAW